MNKKNFRVGFFDVIICIVSIMIFLFVSTLMINSGDKKGSLNNEAYYDERNPDDQLVVSRNIQKKVEVRVYRSDKGIIEVLDIEEYLKGVVAAEMPAEFNIEALKAQSVAARTYMIAHMKDWGGIPCVKAREHNADICDSTHCQVFIDEGERRKKWGEDYESFNKKVSKAVDDTRGDVITYEGNIIDSPYYFAASSGITENAESVFTEARPYLKSVDSFGDSKAPKFTGEKRIDKIEFIKIMKNNYSGIELYKDSIMDNIKIMEKTKAGNVQEIAVGGVSIRGIDFRKVLSLNSADFIISEDGNDIVILCRGYGHEVGMSQWGARGMADIGKDYKQILTHYYTGTDIKKIY